MMLRPIWYYQAKLMPQGMLSSIVSFGNPLVWWPGFIAVLMSFYVAITRKDKLLRMLLIAYCSQYLPWILVPRLTFIYHYFAMVPFLVLILTYYIKEYLEAGSASQKKMGLRLFSRRLRSIRTVLSNSIGHDYTVQIFLLFTVDAGLEFLLTEQQETPTMYRTKVVESLFYHIANGE